MEVALPRTSQFTDCETGVVWPLGLPTGSQMLGLRLYLKALYNLKHRRATLNSFLHFKRIWNALSHQS